MDYAEWKRWQDAGCPDIEGWRNDRKMAIYNKAVSAEPGITSKIQEIGAKEGMSVVGLDYRIKGVDSYARKAALSNKPINDIVRYTYTAAPAEYTEKSTRCMLELEKSGYNIIGARNTWLQPNAIYRGVNTNMVSPQGTTIEVQFHTPESYALKNGELHQLYEKYRAIGLDEPGREELYEQMREMSASLTTPAGVEKIK
jgi:hypothetical protein